MYIATVSLEIWMWFHLDLYHQITRLTAKAGIAFSADTEVDAVVNTFWDIYGFLNALVTHALTTAGGAWILDYCAFAITLSTNLLNHEWSLPNRLKPSTPASSTLRGRSAWLGTAALAGATYVGTTELHRLLGAIDGIHEVDFDCKNYVFATTLCTTLAAATSATLATLATKEFFKFIEDIAKRIASLAAASTLTELILKSLESTETSKALAKPTKWITASLLLLITRHSSLIINSLFSFVPQRFIRFIYFIEFFLRSCCLIDIWMIFLGLLEICLLDVAGAGTPWNSED